VISHGGDEPSSRRSHLVAAAAVLLLVGAVLGGGIVAGYRDRLPWPGRPADVPALTAGSIMAATLTGDQHRYLLDLFNPGPARSATRRSSRWSAAPPPSRRATRSPSRRGGGGR
jgi:hypothetical protein